MKRERGSVFVVTLATLSALVVVTATLAAANRVATHAAENRMLLVRARMAAESGIQEAIATLEQQDLAHAMKSDPWASLGSAGQTSIPVGADSFQIEIKDESSLVNLNSATDVQLKKLPLTDEQVATLMDWRETSTSPRALGAKDEFYNALAKPYNAKLNPFDTVNELLIVKDLVPGDLYGTSATRLVDVFTAESLSEDKDLNGKDRLDANSATADQLVGIGIPLNLANEIVQSQGSYVHVSDVLSLPQISTDAAKAILDNVGVGSAEPTGLTNINTATPLTLSSVPNLSSDLASEISDQQSTGFHSLGELLDLPGMTLQNLLGCINQFCVSSRSFEVRVMGRAGRMKVGLEASLTLGDNGQVSITREEPYPYSDDGEHWGWPQESPAPDQGVSSGS